MNPSVEMTGKTVDEAIDAALSVLNIEREKAQIEILETPKKGALGIFGNRDAKVRVSCISSPESTVEAFLNGVFQKMNVEATVTVEQKEDELHAQITGDQVNLLIGRHGETLDALQYLSSLVVKRKFDVYTRVVLDAEGYRSRREESLKRLANSTARKAVKYHRNMMLEPMSPYERRIIHSELQADKLVNTHSVGEEPYRKVVITPVDRD